MVVFVCFNRLKRLNRVCQCCKTWEVGWETHINTFIIRTAQGDLVLTFVPQSTARFFICISSYCHHPEDDHFISLEVN